jgi:2'-5' RNA ligase
MRAKSRRSPIPYTIQFVAISAFIVKVPGAESLVGKLRERFDPSSRLGVPAHVTVLFPFMSPSEISADVLQRAQRALEGTAAFSFELSTVGRFSATTYLAPAVGVSFVAMAKALCRSFPAYPPYANEHEGLVPHLTVAHGTVAAADETEHALRVELIKHGPVTAFCQTVDLIENSTGRWRDMHSFRLAPT